jgi:hypothetical protein
MIMKTDHLIVLIKALASARGKSFHNLKIGIGKVLLHQMCWGEYIDA